jgi:hypothetical protein
MEINSSIPVKGMNLDSITSQKGDGIYSLMFNGLTESDDHKYTASNEPANIKLVNLPDGYFLIGHVRIRNSRIVVFLVNPAENKSEIGYFDYVENPTLDKNLSEAITFEDVASLLSTAQGSYTQLVYSTESNYSAKVSNDTANEYFDNISSENPPSSVLPYPSPDASVETENAITFDVKCNCLNFKITSPIYHAVYKPNICDDRIYWTDGLNPPRYLIVDNIEGTEPFVSTKQRVTANDGTAYCPPTEFLNELDCGKIRIFSLMSQPDIDIVDIQENGSLMVGSYQFAIAYVDKTNNRLTRFFDITNPVIINEDSYALPFAVVQGAPYNLFSTKSIKMKISNFDPKYTHYQLGIIENLNGSKNIFQLGPYPTDRTEFIYTGNEQQKQRLSFDEFYQQRPVYETADIMSTAGDKLLIGGLSTNPLPNLQRVANNIKLNWQTIAIPYLLPEYSYKGGAFASNYRGYMRGEVYPFGIVFEFEDGTNSPVYHIPGRKSTSYDEELLTDTNNKDLIQNDPCVTDSFPRWKIYDTSTIDQTFSEYDDLINGNIGDDSLVTSGEYLYKETVTETINIAANKAFIIDVKQDTDTLIDNTSDNVFVFLSNNSPIDVGQIKLTKKSTNPRNTIKITIVYKYPGQAPNVVFVGEQKNLDNYVSLQTIVEEDFAYFENGNLGSLYEELYVYGFTVEITYGTSTTNGNGQGSEYIQFALDKAFNILRQGKISVNWNSKPLIVLDKPFITGYLASTPDNTVDPIRTFKLTTKCDNIAWRVPGNYLLDINVTLGDEQLLDSLILSTVNLYASSATNYIINENIKSLIPFASTVTKTNSTYSSKNFTSTIITDPNNPNSTINTDVWTGSVTISTAWELTLQNYIAAPNLVKKILQCDKIPHQKGTFAYWESTERYPCDEDVWGSLSGQAIRHHKFPDVSKISHFNTLKALNKEVYENLNEDIAFIYPIGIAVDHASVVNAFITALKDPTNYPNITKEQVSKIKGYKIVRGNRVNDASIVARGLLYDVWQHDKKLGKDFSKTFYYSNYPYNDLRPDPFISTGDGHYDITDYSKQSSYITSNSIKHPYHTGAGYGSKNDRYTFLSPETSFAKPKIDGYLILNQEQTGLSYGHYVPVADHAKYQRLRGPGYLWSFVLANTISLISSLQIGTSSKIDLAGYVGTIIPNRDRIRDLMKLGIPFTNFTYQYNSVGFYNTFSPVTTEGNTRRRIDIIQYLRKDIENVGDKYQFNNLDREHSLYIKVNDTLPSPSTVDQSRYKWTDITSINSPTKIVTKPISSYYASIKRDLPDQYGLISTVQYCFTGVKYYFDQIALQGGINNILNSTDVEIAPYENTDVYGKLVFGAGQEKDTIYGGDIFIGRFAVKRKHNYFLSNRRKFPDGTDVNYSDVPNVGYPTYFFDTMTRLQSDDEGETSTQKVKNFEEDASTTINEANSDIGQNGGNTTAGTSGIRLGARRTLLSLKNIFRNLQNKPNDYFDYPINNPNTSKIGEFGQIYLHSYGIPYFFVESIINVDLRHRGTNAWEDFYPHTEPDIPDTWLEEDIKYDEFFGYNRDFSAQNTDNPFIPLQLNYNPLEDCFDYMPNRVAYSQQANFDELMDNYLLFRVNDYADFGYDYGYLKNIAFLPGDKTLIQFENATKVFSSFSTLEPANSTKPIYLGSGTLFQQGITLSDSEVGYAGNQNRAFILTELGVVWLDVKRGSVFSFGGGINEISLNNKNWFKSNLPFNIIKDFPEMYTDNPFHNDNPVGITMAYDNKYQRVIITKHDYKVRRDIDATITYDITTKTFKESVGNTTITLKNTSYFINKSWTISYSFLNKEWISFHSYTPNAYISLNQRFLSTNISGTTQSFWTHNQTNKVYQVVYGSLVEYILEFPYYAKGATNILGSIMMYSESLRYSGQDDYAQNLSYFFNKCVIWNKYQTTGLLNLIWDDPNDDTLAIDYPVYNSSSINILYSSKDDSYTFNHIWNVLNAGKGVWAESLTNPIIKGLNLTTEEYAKPQDEMDRMRGKESFVRMIQDAEWKYKFKVYLQVEKENPSIY